MSASLSTGIMQNVVKKALTTPSQEPVHLSRVLQKMKPELTEYHDAAGISARLSNVEKTNIAVHQNPAIVLDSLLHKTASQRSKGGLRYDDLIEYI